MFQGEIYNRIMTAVKLKVKDAQKAYDDKCLELERKLEADKEELASEVVENFFKQI